MNNNLKTKLIWINGRFLDRPVTGVERVAREILQALSLKLNESGILQIGNINYQFKLIMPASSDSVIPWENIPAIRVGKRNGHLWEQTTLLKLTQGDWLISLCNTGPIFKRKHLLFLHDAQVFAIPQNFTRAFRWWYRVLFSVGGRNAKVILTNSAFSRNEIVRHVGLNPQKITPIWLGSDHVLRIQPDTQILDKYGIQSGSYIFAVASVNPNKNFAALLTAIDNLGDTAPPCVIAGQRYDKVFGGKNADTQSITHVGYVSDAELYALYKNALCLVFPSFYEGFGLPPLEAMTLGCPTIVSKTSAMPEVCGDAALYCDPNSVQSIAHAIKMIQTNPSLRTTLSAKGYERVKQFSWDIAAEKMVQILYQASKGEV